jgi:hypothetical protein
MATLRFGWRVPTAARKRSRCRSSRVLNGGYAGRDTAEVQAHIDELAELGVPGPDRIPTMYPLSDYLAVQGERVAGAARPHLRRGRVGAGGARRTPRVPPTTWSRRPATTPTARWRPTGWPGAKQSAPDFLGDVAWRWGDVAETTSTRSRCVRG